VLEDDPREDLRDRGSAAVKAALAVVCPVCEAGPGEGCQNLADDLRLPRQRIVHFCRVPFPPLADLLAPDARAVGEAADVVEHGDGDRVVVGGSMAHVWDAGDTAAPRLAASLVRMKAAVQKTVIRPPNVFGMATRWVRTPDMLDATGTPTLLALLVPQSGGHPPRPQWS
jgi:hypothetical protein